MSHPSFSRVVSDTGRRRRSHRTSSSPAAWQSSLGVSSRISGLNLASFFLHSTSSILFLVFLNSIQPFLISQLGEIKRQGSLSGTLVFSDELLSIVLVLFWGSLADLIGTKFVAVTGYLVIALSLLSYTFATKPWPDLLFCRLAFAVGGSAVTAMLSGILNSYSAAHDENQVKQSTESIEHQAQDFVPPPQETTPLLTAPASSTSTGGGDEEGKVEKSKHGRLAAMTGLMTGVGALIAVFFLLRLPTLLASIHDRNAPSDLPDDGGDEAIRRGTRESFYFVSALSLLIGVLLSIGLKMDIPTKESEASISRREGEFLIEEERQTAALPSASARQARRERLKARMARRASKTARLINAFKQFFTGIFAGFSLARSDLSLTLGYLSGGLARACTIATTVFVPLLVTRFYYTSGLCSDLPSPDVPPSELKRVCRQAFTIASILSGVIQLISLLLAPLIGWLCEVTSPAITLLFTTSIGTASFLLLGFALPNDGDPRSTIAWVSAVGIGICQIANIVASLALCAGAKARLQLHKKTSDNSQAQQQNHHHQQHHHSTATSSHGGGTGGGSIAGAYSATGGIFILLISKLGGSLSDLYAPAAFILLAFMSALTAIVSLLVVLQERRAITKSPTPST